MLTSHVRLLFSIVIVMLVSFVSNTSYAQTWGAISLAPDGVFSSLWNRYSRAMALDEARASCEQRSSLPEKCTTIAASDATWIAALNCDVQERRVSSVASGSTVLDALEVAYQQAFDRGYERKNCVLRVAIKADGTHAPVGGVTRVWGALSLSTDGKLQSVWNRSYQAVAEAEALSDCRAFSSSPDKCTTVSAYGSSWIIGVRCFRENIVQVIVARGDTEAEAFADIYNYAKDRGYDPARCRTSKKITANGSHKN